MGILTDLLNTLFSASQQTGQERNHSYNSHISRRNERIRQEVTMIAPRFSKNGGSIDFDENNCDWLIINRYALPKKWKEWYCRLMLVFPQGYPDVPPIGFYLNKRFQLKGGKIDTHFTGGAHYGAPDLQKQGWFWYCVHLKGGAWQPQVDYRKPDNLWTYLNMIRESLTNDF